MLRPREAARQCFPIASGARLLNSWGMLRIVDFQLYRIDLQTRIPFKYGIATMTRVPEIFVRLAVDVDGKEAVGFSSDCLPPKWFTKIPEKALDAEVEEMLAVIRHAAEVTRDVGERSVFAFWKALYDGQDGWAAKNGIAPLLAHFGTSLIERALIDAFCRAKGARFTRAVSENLFHIDFGAIHRVLRGNAAAKFLPPAPLPRVTARHTVGLADPLTDDDIPAGERLNDGLPQSLEACIRVYGLKHFKIKVNDQLATDLPRVKRIAGILHAQCGSNFAFTLDANEQFKSFADFREFWRALTREASLHPFMERLLFVEQPLHRDYALRPEIADAIKSWNDRPQIIVDESDGTLDAVATALRLGYAGASHKNCKGVIKGIVNCCLLRHNSARNVMSGEDLCNIGPVALLQDLAVMAALGIESVERNGHHYHAGLSQFPGKIQEQVLSHHNDLYHKSSKGWPTLRITKGTIDLRSVNEAPFGTGFLLEAGEFKRVV
jgi:hypothetical protein